MKKELFTGSAVAIVTPFTDDGIDFDKLGSLIEFHIENKTDAIVICGTTGEASTMPDDEHLRAIEYTVKKANGRIHIMAGTGSNDTKHCVELSKAAQAAGADSLLLVTPYYNKASQKGLIQHFLAVANAVSIPIVLYNVPSRTGMSISIETLKELSKHPNIVAIKEASGNMSYASKIAAETDLAIYSGNDDIIVPILSIGGKGVISVVANILPKETHDIVELYLSGKVEESRNLQLKMLDLIESLFVEVNPIPVKTAMNLLGYNVGALRLPLCEMAQSNLERLKNSLTSYGLKI